MEKGLFPDGILLNELVDKWFVSAPKGVDADVDVGWPPKVDVGIKMGPPANGPAELPDGAEFPRGKAPCDRS